MTDCNPEIVRFPSCKGREVEARFASGAITSNGGASRLLTVWVNQSRPRH